jgi:hypothetical protein
MGGAGEQVGMRAVIQVKRRTARGDVFTVEFIEEWTERQAGALQ